VASYLHLIPFAKNGGTEKDCYYVVSELIEDYHTIFVFDQPDRMSESWIQAGAHVVHLHCLHKPIQLYTTLKKIIKDKKYDGIFYWSTIHLPLILAALNGQKSKIAVHVGNPVHSSIKTILKNFLFSSSLPVRNDVCLFPCSQYVADTIIKDPYLKRFPIRVSLNPVTIPDKNPHKLQQIAQDSEIHMGMTARLDPIKDHLTVIKAFKLVEQKFPKVRLHLLGDGVLENSLQELAQGLGLTDKVIFHGNVNNVYDHLQSWHIFLYATTPAEGLGNAVSEAMANGLPCVLSDLPMLRELAGNDQNVHFVPASNARIMSQAVFMLLKYPDTRHLLSQNAFRHARETFNSSRYAKDRLDFLLT